MGNNFKDFDSTIVFDQYSYIKAAQIVTGKVSKFEASNDAEKATITYLLETEDGLVYKVVKDYYSPKPYLYALQGILRQLKDELTLPKAGTSYDIVKLLNKQVNGKKLTVQKVIDKYVDDEGYTKYSSKYNYNEYTFVQGYSPAFLKAYRKYLDKIKKENQKGVSGRI